MGFGDNTFGFSTPVELSEIEAENNSTEDTTESTAGETEESTPQEDNVEETEQQEEETEEQTQPQEQPLILGKFKTVADLEKAYRNLEAYNTKLAQHAKAAPKVEQQQTQVDEEAAKDQQMADWYDREVITNPIGANAALARYMAQKVINEYKTQIDSKLETELRPIVAERNNDLAFKEFSKKYTDADKYVEEIKAAMQEISEEEPELIENPVKMYREAYFRGKSKALEVKAQQAFDNGKKSAQEQLKQKKSIHNETKNTNLDDDELPAGIKLVNRGDGYFL